MSTTRVGTMAAIAVVSGCISLSACGMETLEQTGLIAPTLADPPPPISGGSLLVTEDDRFAVAADPDRDQVHVVRLDAPGLARTFDFVAHDEPGRLVEGPDGRVHVVLRGGGGIASIDPSGVRPTRETAVCNAPRGIDVTPEGAIIVSCAGGELVRVDDSGETTTIARLDPDVRDVVAMGDRLLVSRFRRAEVMVIDPDDGSVERTLQAPSGAADRDRDALAVTNVDPTPEPATPELDAAIAVADAPATTDATEPRQPSPPPLVPNTAFRLRRQGDRAFLIAQRSRVVSPDGRGGGAGGYEGGGGSGGSGGGSTTSRPDTIATGGTTSGDDDPPASMETIVAEVHPDHIDPPFVVHDAVLGVDVAIDAARSRIAVAVPSEIEGDEAQRTRRIQTGTLLHGSSAVLPSAEATAIDGQATSVAFTSDGRLVALSREPAFVQVGEDAVELSSISRRDGGHDLFHVRNGTMACASCHPEGGDDGQIWSENGGVARRTRGLRGGLLDTLPFHAAGDMEDMEAILARRMPSLPDRELHAEAISLWLDALPEEVPPFVEDSEPAIRGETVFEARGCGSCHTRPLGTSLGQHDVGTGGPRDVPWLLELAYRAPYMASGCARTIEQALAPECAGAQHGEMGALTDTERRDLVAFLATW